jgi:ubiquinone/menaquinone biosynthesis C-methylase UbiE
MSCRPMASLGSRLRALLGGSAPAGAPPTYGRSWDNLARHDALGAICDGADPESFEAYGREHGERLRALIQPEWRVLDFGCGVGRLETYLAPHCREMHGVDVSAEMVTRARARLAGVGNVRFHQLDGPSLPMFADGFFDFALAFLVFHHVAKQDTYLVLREFRRVLRPGGRFFVNFPNLTAARYTEVFHDYALRRERAAHRVRPYTAEEVRWLMQRIGAEVVEERVGDEIDVLATFLRA